MRYRWGLIRCQGLFKVPLKEFICNDQGFERSPEIPIAGSDCLVYGGFVRV